MYPIGYNPCSGIQTANGAASFFLTLWSPLSWLFSVRFQHDFGPHRLAMEVHQKCIYMGADVFFNAIQGLFFSVTADILLIGQNQKCRDVKIASKTH